MYCMRLHRSFIMSHRTEYRCLCSLAYFPGISQVEVEIGGQRIDRQYGDIQMIMTSEQQRGYFKMMIGNTTQLTFITDPSFSDVESPCDSTAPRQVCAPSFSSQSTCPYS